MYLWDGFTVCKLPFYRDLLTICWDTFLVGGGGIERHALNANKFLLNWKGILRWCSIFFSNALTRYRSIFNMFISVFGTLSVRSFWSMLINI